MERKEDKRLTQEQGESSTHISDPRAQSSSLQSEISRYPQYAASAHQSKQMPKPSDEAKDSLPRSPTPTLKSDSISESPSPLHEANPTPNHLQVALKFLVSNSASGLIIGRAGSTISDLQAKSHTRIKLSQGGDYYPGTSDRVCLIQGVQGNASIAVEMVLAKLYELQSSQQQAPTVTRSDAASEKVPEEPACTSFIVRLLVPSTCCGMIIGRGGSNIKSLKDKSEVSYIQLSPKEHEIMIGGFTLSTSERIMTITGPNFASCVNCVKIILSDMAQNPEISRYVNMTTSYSKNLISAAPSSYAESSAPGFFLEQHEPFGQHVIGQPQIVESPPRYGMNEAPFLATGQFGSSSPPGTGLQMQPDQISHLPQQLLQHHQSSPGNYDSISHGDMPLPLLGDPSAMVQSQPYGPRMMSSSPRRPDNMPPSSSFPQYRQSQPVGQTGPFWPRDVSTSSPGAHSSPSGDLSSIEQLTQSFQGQASIQRHHSNSSSQHLVSSAGPVNVQLGVPDNRIGSILGRGGKTLTELQGLSQTKIRISQRGKFIQGTQNRIVTITGDTTQDVEHARHLINQRLAASASRSSTPS
mmetsp:Transcript_14087/g.30099  ORF Transcript_14087/g.30099 Transcript_14087/m.30099 type:complete len:581 (+) Transcript_14087:381-2123(+)